MEDDKDINPTQAKFLAHLIVTPTSQNTHKETTLVHLQISPKALTEIPFPQTLRF